MQGKKKKLSVFLLLFMLVAMAVPAIRARAAGSGLQVVEIDYEKETLKVSSSADTYLYYSNEKKKSWECAGKFVNNEFVLDISWVSKTKDYVLVLKGDTSEDISVTLPKQDKSLKVTYNCKDECLTFLNAENRRIFWRKADSTVWTEVTITNGAMDATTLDLFRRFYARGATLYFRTGQIAGDAAKTGARPSKEVKLSLKKQASEPKLTVKAPGTITVTEKMEYQKDGETTWTACSGKTLDIAKNAEKAFYNGTTPGQDTKIFVRVAATEKNLPSATATLTVLAQEAEPTDITYEFVNVSTLKVSIPELTKEEDGKTVVTREKPSSKNPYEYTVVAAGEQLKDDATWTAITSESVEISSAKAPTGATIFVRKRGRSAGTLSWQVESQAASYVVGDYPVGGTLSVAADADSRAVEMKEGTLFLVKQEGIAPTGLKFDIALTEQFKENDIVGITCGGKDLKFASSKSSDGLKISVEITDTAEYEEAVATRDKEQDVKIKMKNGEVIDKVKLTILRGASVQNSKIFSVTHGKVPGSPYTFVVVPGLKLDKDPADATGKEHVKTAVSGLSFMDEALLSGTDYTVAQNTDGSYTVTIPVAAFDKAFLKQNTEQDKEYPLTIEMDNGQKLTKGISVKLYEEVKAEGIQTFRKSVAAVLEEDIKITLKADGIINIGNVTWNGQPIECIVQQEATTKNITITLKCDSNGGLAKGINQLVLPAEGQGSTAPIIFEITDSSGAVVSRASLIYWLTLTP